MVEKSIIQGITILLYAIGAIGASIASPKTMVPSLLGSVIILLYFYHLKSKGSSLGGYQIDNTFVVPLFLIACVIFFIAIKTSKQPEVYDESPNNLESCKKTGKTLGDDGSIGGGILCKQKQFSEMNILTSTKFIIVYLVIFSSAFIIYEIALKNGIKEALLRSVSIICIAFIIISIMYVLLSLGDSFEDYSKLTSGKLDDLRKSVIFKGSITGNDYKPDQNIKLIYNGNNVDVKMYKDGITPLKIDCSMGPSGNSLWGCDNEDKSFNRIESKCGGDWWLTTDKGCLSDGFSEFYRYLYILVMFALITITMYSIFKSPDFFSVKGQMPLFLCYGVIIGYHIIYLICNFIVSWTTNESVLFQKFTSEFLKGTDGFWTEDNTCDEKFKDSENGSGSHLIENYDSIWSNDSVSSKIKILFNIVLLFCIIGFSIKYIGSKYIQPQINKLDSLETSLKTVYMYLITTIATFGGLQIIYLFYTAIIADDCIVNRITSGVSIDKKETQKYCKGKNPENDAYCSQDGVEQADAETRKGDKKANTSGYTKEHCKKDQSCMYDNSFTINELIRCQLDSHGGLYYHIAFMIMIPLLFTLIKSTSIMELIK